MRRDVGLWILALVAACSEPPAPQLVTDDPSDAPIAELSAAQTQRFALGDAAFELVFREAQGLGPRFIRQSCTGCHENDARGPGIVHRRMDGTLIRPRSTDGASESIPEQTHRRLGPPVYGRGYLEAVSDAAIANAARAQERHPHVSGRVPRLADGSIGRFGLKSRLSTLDAFVADAYLNDMGITSPHQPDEEGEDAKPGVDLATDVVEQVADYVRMLAIPRRDSREGAALFAELGCATCHVPHMATRADYPVPQIDDAPIYSDMLLHDMGDALADGVAEGAATGREWRTAPLMGLRFMSAFLHDGRAASVREAIELHAGEAEFARDAFRASADKDRLVGFVEAL